MGSDRDWGRRTIHGPYGRIVWASGPAGPPDPSPVARGHHWCLIVGYLASPPTAPDGAVPATGSPTGQPDDGFSSATLSESGGCYFVRGFGCSRLVPPVRLRRADGDLGHIVMSHRLRHGHGVAVGDIDGRNGQDILVVQGCVGNENEPDMLFLNDGSGRSWHRLTLARGVPGCGDVAASLDFDRDGKDDFVVLNGGGSNGRLDLPGPDQLLTMGTWPAT